MNAYLLELNEEPNYPFLNSYWTDKKRIPLKLTNGKNWLGFALINDYTIITSNTISIAEFCILPPYRNQGLGRYFANEILQKYNGNWEIRYQIKHNIADKFWKNIIVDFKETQIGIENVLNFVIEN